MINEFIYSDIILDIQQACRRHIKNEASADHLQHVIQREEVAIAAIEESDIRNFLTNIESRLELIKFTVNTGKQLQQTQAVARYVLAWLDTYYRHKSDYK